MTNFAKIGAGVGLVAMAAGAAYIAKNTGAPKIPDTPTASSVPCGPTSSPKITLDQLAGRWMDDQTGDELVVDTNASDRTTASSGFPANGSPASAPAPSGGTNAPSDNGLPPSTYPGLSGKQSSAETGAKGPSGSGLSPDTYPTRPGTAGNSGTSGEGNIHATGHHTWDGNYDGTKLTLTRYPEAREMDETAPGWSKGQAQGKVKWELELTPRMDCGQLVLEGDWYPGSFKWHE
ncbi:MAG TPA: hypothetical protein VG815_01635, partial [Chloroflexota bacterium]|nr:hypothetical protein [Chloroflexota bacterium]